MSAVQPFDPTAEIEMLGRQINVVADEHARLTPGEYALLMLLRHAVQIIEAMNERMTGDGR